MSVYVDAPIWPYGRMMMCHMLADDLDSLHAMADRIGVARRWFQNKPGFPHYDICKAKRALAVQFGAVEIDRRKFVELVKRTRAQVSDGYTNTNPAFLRSVSSALLKSKGFTVQ